MKTMSLKAGLLATCLISAASAAPQSAAVPDFSSNQAAWTGIGGGEFIPVPGSPRPVTQDSRYRYVPNGQGAQPTYRIGDVTNPNLKQWAKDAMKKDNDEVLAGKIGYTPRSSCKPGGVPGFMVMGGGSVFFVQSRDKVLMMFDGDAQVRRVHLNATHSANPKPSWYGESIGHYEGDTLVVDTIGLNSKTFVDAYRTPHTEKLRVTERWRLIDNGERLEVLITIDDPDTFNQPWQALRRYAREKAASFPEEICAENNQHLFDYGIPEADKPDF